MAPLGPMMDFRVWVRPTWSGAANSGTGSPTAGPVLIWPQRAAAKTASHRVRCMIHRILAWADHGALGNWKLGPAAGAQRGRRSDYAGVAPGVAGEPDSCSSYQVSC